MATQRIKYSIENGTTVIPIGNTTAEGFLKLEGRTGFGIAPTSLVLTEGSIEGSKWRRTRRGSRTIDLPLAVFGADRADVEIKLRLLAKTLSDRRSIARIVATYPDGARVYTKIHYSGGLDPQYGPGGDTQGQGLCRIVLTLVAPGPYWTDERPVQYAVTAQNQGRSIIPNLAELRVSSSQALGTLAVANPGDVDAYPVWTIRGPGNGFTASLGTLGIVYLESIAVGETITIDAVRKTATSSLTGDAYTALDIAPKFFAIPPGSSNVDVLVENSSADTLVTMYFNPRRELVY